MPATIQLGQAANLLFGYLPVWNPSASNPASPFFAPPVPPVRTPVAGETVPSSFTQWDGYPTITLHETPESLVSAIYDFNVAKFSADPPGLNIPSGPLVLDDADSRSAIAAVGKFLGLDLTNGECYMLVTRQRVNSTSTHPFVANPGQADRSAYLTPSAIATIGKLTPAQNPGIDSVLYNSKLTLADASDYIEAIYTLGTHFVSQITSGDVILQVFAYPPASFGPIKTVFANDATTQPDGTQAVTGLTANSFAIYSTPASNGFGYVTGYSDIVCLSRDPALTAAIAKGAWNSDYSPNHPNIFAATAGYQQLLPPLTQVVPIGVLLTPLAALISNVLVANPWNRLVKGALMQKYGSGVAVPLSSPMNYDWSSIFPEAIASWTGSIVTPRVDIYQERVDLAQVNLQGGAVIAQQGFPNQSFTSFSQILEATTQPGAASINLPSDNITLIAQIIDTTAAQQTPVLSMSTAALQQLQVYCEDMYGALIFADGEASTNRKVALDGFLFETSPTVDPTTSRYKVDLSGVLTGTPSPALVSKLKQSIEFSVVAGESLLQASGTNAAIIQELEQDFLVWLAGIIPADTTDVDLANCRARALYLANNVSTYGSDVVYVPFVKYETYREYVGDLASQAVTLNGQLLANQQAIETAVSQLQVMDSIETLNENVKAIGGVLTQYFGVLASGREQMDGYYDSVLTQLENELATTEATINDLTGKLTAQQQLINTTTQQFQSDYAAWATDQVFQAVTSIVTGVFTLGATLAAEPENAPAAFKEILEVFEQIQALLESLEKIEAVTSELGDQVDNLNNMSNSISTLSGQTTSSGKPVLQMPASIALKDFALNVNASLVNVPTGGKLASDKAQLEAQVQTLVNIGTALLEARTKASQLRMEQYNKTRLKTINGNQAAQLSALTSALNLQNVNAAPQLSVINLIGISGQLEFQLKQVLATLAQTLELQNGAIQFEYFGTPVAITSFTLSNLQSAISTQDANILNALQILASQNTLPQPVPSPITVTIKGVTATKVSGGNVFQFPIALSAKEFSTYDMVRIDTVIPNITNIQSTTPNPVTGKQQYEIALTCLAKPFQDRSPTKQTKTFASVSRNFGPYVYDLASGKVTFGANSDGFADQVSHLTPFSLWQISLPNNVTNNQGIEFSSVTVDIVMQFQVTAIYDDSQGALRTMSAALRSPRAGMMMSQAMSVATSRGTTVTPPSLTALETAMYNDQACLNNWDAVFSLLSGPVNSYLYQQFQAYIKTLDPANTDNLMKVEAYYCNGVVPVPPNSNLTTVNKLAFKLSNPLLEFEPGQDAATVEQNILSGSVTQGSMYVSSSTWQPGSCNLVSGNVNFTASASNSQLTLSVPGVFESGIQVLLSTAGTLPQPLQPGSINGTTVTGVTYWTVNWNSASTGTTLQLSATPDGPPITLTSAGTGTHTISPLIYWEKPSTVTTTGNPYIQASVPLDKISGIVNPPSGQGQSSETHTVVLNFPKGSFSLTQFAVDPPTWQPKDYAQISQALANYFHGNKITYQVQTINYTNLNQDAALQPSAFVLNTLTTNSGNNILQMLIATSGTLQNAHSISVPEPIAYDPAAPVSGESDFNVSLMISSQLMFQHIFVDSFNKGGTNIVVEAVQPPVSFEAWSAKISSGSATGAVTFNNPYTVGSGINQTQVQYRINASNNNVTWPLAGFTFSRTLSAGLALNYNNGDAATGTGGTPVSFQYSEWYNGNEYSPGGWGPWTDATATAFITATGSYELAVTGSGSAQVVGFTSDIPPLTFDKSSTLKPDGPCDCNDNDLQIAVLNAMKATVPTTLQKYIQQVTFQPVSVFALENLLFPADQLITLQKARVPADLLIVGSFLAQVRKTSPNYNVTIVAASGAKGSLNGTAFQNGVGTGSATLNGTTKQFIFTYGPISVSQGGAVQYTIDIEAGTVNPPLLVVVDQPDPDGTPANVILLPPGFSQPATS